ncbi:MAG: TonB family protein [Bacteroidota bacterium]
MLTHYTTTSDKKLQLKNGLYKEFYDDGELILHGHFVNGLKQGEWIEHGLKGNYKNNKREGLWEAANEYYVHLQKNYSNGKLDGDYIELDSLGNKVVHYIYKNDEIIDTLIESSWTIKNETGEQFEPVEEMPRFYGCEEIGDRNERQHCATQKLLQYIYGNITYPKDARKKGIEGKVLVNFVINKEGKATDIEILRGVCEDFEDLCRNIIDNMPNWIPGKQKGEPVNVIFTLPINFKLE